MSSINPLQPDSPQSVLASLKRALYAYVYNTISLHELEVWILKHLWSQGNIVAQLWDQLDSRYELRRYFRDRHSARITEAQLKAHLADVILKLA